MKTRFLLGILLLQFSAGAIERGVSRDTVLAELGEPSGSMQHDDKEILLFSSGSVTLQKGVVVEINLSEKYMQQSKERAAAAKKERAEKQTALDEQKRLYPEDHVIRIECSYNKDENWDRLPENIRPAAGKYVYDVYIPQGYHSSDSRYYNTIVLESPALWESIKDRVHKEQWIVVILQDANGAHVAGTINGNFLAAFDDAHDRFRISRERTFFIGRIPSAIFATMRPAAGIILQEPDFRGLAKSDFNPDFLRLNSNLSAYALLGNSNRDNVKFQGRFIAARIPKYEIWIYEGNTSVLSQELADKALDWMKKEYRIP